MAGGLNRRYSAAKVLPFIAEYNVDVDEFAKSAFAYKTFNDFFYRRLKPAARPIAPGDDVAVLRPTDATSSSRMSTRRTGSM